MKRIIICSVLLAGAIIISLQSHFMVQRLHAEIDLRIDALTEILHDDNAAEVLAQTVSLVALWQEEERQLVHFVRHSHIDVISVSMVRLPALAEHGEYGEVRAELETIRWQMRHIREAEQLTLDNLL